MLSLIPIVVLGVALALHLAAQIRREALADARNVAQVTAQVGIQPQLGHRDLDAGLSDQALARVDRVLRAEQLDNRVVRVKVWNRTGRVVYSDDRGLVGRRFAPSDELAEALSGRVASEISTLTRAEQRDDRRFRRLLEVYVPLRFAGAGRPAGAFEIYMPYAPIAARITRQTRELVLMLLLGLAFLWAVLLRIAVRTVRRLRRQAQENHYQATHDALTDLPNRALFHDRTGQALLAARRTTDMVAVLLLDLDGFKDVNDTLGHRTGDLLLEQVGPRLTGVLRESDTVARLGGDEFAILLPRVADADAALAIGAKLARSLAATFSLDDVPVHVQASIGVALYPDHGVDADDLLQRADVAMYRAKEQRQGCVLYSSETDPHSVERLALVGELREALDGGQLTLVYQPKLNLRTRTIEGVEALLRWDHPERGLVPPAEFIPLAEHTALMPELTSWVLAEALRQASVWRAAGMDLGVAVNVSATSVASDALLDEVTRLIAATEVPADRLTLEVTESAVMADPMRARAVLCRLSAVGVKIAIDDFGTGQSSLAYLKRLPVDELKIDRSFVRDLERDANDAAIVAAAIDLARNLGLVAVAEGVETQAGLGELERRSCDLVQGYAVSRPLAPDKLDIWLASARRGVYGVAAPVAPDRAATVA